MKKIGAAILTAAIAVSLFPLQTAFAAKTNYVVSDNNLHITATSVTNYDGFASFEEYGSKRQVEELTEIIEEKISLAKNMSTADEYARYIGFADAEDFYAHNPWYESLEECRLSLEEGCKEIKKEYSSINTVDDYCRKIICVDSLSELFDMEHSAVMYGGSQPYHGLADKKGTVIKEAVEACIPYVVSDGIISKNNDFNEYYYLDNDPATKTNGYFRMDGTVMEGLSYTFAQPFGDGVAFVRTGAWDDYMFECEKMCLVDKTGKDVLTFPDEVADSCNGIGDSWDAKFHTSCLYVYTQGAAEGLIPFRSICFQFGDTVNDYILDFSSPIVDKYGYMDHAGNIVIPQKYDEVWEFSGGVASVEKDGKYGAIDKSDNAVVPFEYDYISGFSDNYATAIKDNTGYIIDDRGNIKTNLTDAFADYEDDDDVFISRLNDGLFTVENKNKSVTVFDIDGNKVWTLSADKYDNFSDVDEGVLYYVYDETLHSVTFEKNSDAELEYGKDAVPAGSEMIMFRNFSVNAVLNCDEFAVVYGTDGKELSENSVIYTGCRLKTEKGEEYEIAVLGDINGDGKNDVSDARLALRKAINLEYYASGAAQYLACDVNGSGEVTVADARQILRVAIRLDNGYVFE